MHWRDLINGSCQASSSVLVVEHTVVDPIGILSGTTGSYGCALGVMHQRIARTGYSVSGRTPFILMKAAQRHMEPKKMKNVSGYGKNTPKMISFKNVSRLLLSALIAQIKMVKLITFWGVVTRNVSLCKHLGNKSFLCPLCIANRIIQPLCKIGFKALHTLGGLV